MSYINILDWFTNEMREELGKEELRKIMKLDLPVQTAYFYQHSVKTQDTSLFWVLISTESQHFIKERLYEAGYLKQDEVYSVPFEKLEPFLKEGLGLLKTKPFASASLVAKARYDADGMHATALFVPGDLKAEIYFFCQTEVLCYGIPLVSSRIGGTDTSIWLVDYVKTLEK